MSVVVVFLSVCCNWEQTTKFSTQGTGFVSVKGMICGVMMRKMMTKKAQTCGFCALYGGMKEEYIKVCTSMPFHLLATC